MKQYVPHCQILFAGFLWGMIGLFSRNLSVGGLSPSSIVLVRNLGGLFVLALLFLLTDRSIFRIRLKHLPYFFGTGIVSVLLFTLCYFSSQQICSLAVAAILLYTAPTFVVIFSAILWKDQITGKKLAALVIAFVGCSFVTGIWSGNLSLSAWGLLLGLGSGFFYGLYTIFARYALSHYPPYTVTFYTFLFAGVGAIFFSNSGETIHTLQNSRMLFLSLGLVIISTVLPYLFYTKGLSRLDSGKASILASVEPVVAALVGILAFGEPMGIPILLGLLCILISIYILR
ncbi:MAG: hypothetical protein K0S60_93 [Evtepia sp.]|jgi:drug/metabolite transporter (DMT)-like permease|nr:hypothetical protein [Evtepia sp.]